MTTQKPDITRYRLERFNAGWWPIGSFAQRGDAEFFDYALNSSGPVEPSRIIDTYEEQDV